MGVFETIVIGQATYSIAEGKTALVTDRLVNGLPPTIHAQAATSVQGWMTATRNLTLVPAPEAKNH